MYQSTSIIDQDRPVRIGVLRAVVSNISKSISCPATCLAGMARTYCLTSDRVYCPRPFLVGDAFIIPQKDVLESNLYGFDVGMGNLKSYGFYIENQEGRAKFCDFSLLVGTVIPYKSEGSDFVRDDLKGRIQSDTDLAKQIRGMSTQLDIFNYLCANAGKTIEVIDTKIIDIPRIDLSTPARKIIGLRPFTLPIFDFAD